MPVLHARLDELVQGGDLHRVLWHLPSSDLELLELRRFDELADVEGVRIWVVSVAVPALARVAIGDPWDFVSEVLRRPLHLHPSIHGLLHDVLQILCAPVFFPPTVYGVLDVVRRKLPVDERLHAFLVRGHIILAPGNAVHAHSRASPCRSLLRPARRQEADSECRQGSQPHVDHAHGRLQGDRLSAHAAEGGSLAKRARRRNRRCRGRLGRHDETQHPWRLAGLRGSDEGYCNKKQRRSGHGCSLCKPGAAACTAELTHGSSGSCSG
mmetsp:Transcript_76468/g.212391  ORF Transcript_76468/g.212391 Transcript_76468/m.212391 type:complete len:268 (-) Transcript_76468:26-829(-)